MTNFRVSVTYVELDIEYGSCTYGISPCTAAIGVTGEQKCFNTRNIDSDCQDPDNFQSSVKTIRFAKQSDSLLAGVDCIPSIINVELVSPRIKPGVNLGERFSATVSFRNHPHGDVGFDKYYSERDYIAFEHGTFWGKFRARNPFIKGQAIRIYQGFADQEFSDFEVYNLIVDNFSGPDSDGTFRITAVDIFRFLDNDKGQMPRASNGYLSSGIDDSETSITLSPVGIGDEEYPASGIGSIGKEAVDFTRVGDNFTIVRGQYNTAAESHDAEDVFQLAQEYTPQTVDLIIGDMISNYTELSSSNVPSVEWSDEISNYSDVNYSTIIFKPTGIRTLINELIEQVGLIMWPDVKTNLVRLTSLRPVASTAALISDDHIIDGSISAKDQQEKRISEVWTRYNRRNPFEKVDDENNYFSVLATIGSNAALYKNSAIKNVYSRWIPKFGRSVANLLNAQLLSRYEVPPREFQFYLPRSFQIEMGQGVFLTSHILERADGSQGTVPVYIVSISPGAGRRKIIAEEFNFIQQTGLDQRLIIIDYDIYNVNLREIYDELYSTLDEDEDITVIIEENVNIGSVAYYIDSFEILAEDWPVGVTITIQQRGRIQGAGGPGGDASGNHADDGDPGGTALKVTRPVTIDNTTGQIWGGGGGGGGTGGIFHNQGYQTAAGGGGGAGSKPGKGGIGSTYTLTTTYTRNGDPGTTESGGDGGITDNGGGPFHAGDGGGPGQPGSAPGNGTYNGAGGAAGVAVDGDSFITWIDEGDIQGSQIN